MTVPGVSARRRQQRSVIGRSAVLVVDQGLNSVTNIVVTVLVARGASLQQFGVFATTQVGVLLGQTVAMAALGDRWLQADPSQRGSRFATGIAAFRRTAVVAVIAGGVLTLFVGLNAVVIAAAAAPAIAGLDYLRVILIADERPRVALGMDTAYGALQLLGIAWWLSAGGWHGGAGAWLAWATAASIVFGVFATTAVRGQPAIPRHDREPLRSALSLHYGAEALVVSGGAQLALLVVSVRLGVAFNGVLRATSIPFGPLIVLLQASRAVLMPRFRRLDERAGRRLLVGSCAAYSVLCAGCTALAGVITQTERLRVLIGGIHPSLGFVLLTGQLFLTTGLHLLLYFSFRARQRDRSVLISRAVLVGALTLTTLASVATGSSTVFLLLDSVSWVVSAVAMVSTKEAASERA